jgi:hypothetical protein
MDDVDVSAVITATAALETEIASHAEELDKELTPFAPGEKWAYAPAAEREKVRAAIEEKQRARAGEKLFKLEAELVKAEPILAAAVALAEQPPTADEAYRQRSGRPGLSAELWVSLRTLEEIQRQGLEHTLTRDRRPTPSVFLSLYEHALLDPTDTESAVTIRFIEKYRFDMTEGELSVGEISALFRLTQTIKRVRAARVPESIRAAERLHQRGLRVASEAKHFHRVQPVRVTTQV